MTYKHWPAAATELAEQIKQEQLIMLSTLKTAISEGIDHQNYGLLEMLLPRLVSRATTIKAISREINQRFAPPPKAGRPPLWVETIMEVTAKADKILFILAAVPPEMSTNRYITVDFLLRGHTLALAESIGQLLETVAPVANTPEVIISLSLKELYAGL